MLNLGGLAVENVTETADEYVLSVSVSEDAPKVDCCLLQNLVSNGRKEAFFVDTPMHGKRVTLRMLRQRYRCQACGKTAYGTIPHMHEDHRITQRCYAYICKHGARRTWAALGQELGLDPQTISNIWNRWADEQLAAAKRATPRWLGIDELFIMGQYRAVITDIEHNALVNMLPSRKLETLHAYFTSPEFDTKKVDVVTIDMWPHYKTIAKELFPKAKLIVDKFHVIQLATSAMEAVRREERARLRKLGKPNLLGDRYMFLRNFEDLAPGEYVVTKLDTALGQHPIMKEAWHLKERFRDIWKCPSRSEAEALFHDWAHTALDSNCALCFAPVVRAVRNWQDEIFAYHDVQLTNSYTESFNALARRMDRAGNGYSFEALKKRLLMAHGLGFRVQPSLPLFSFGNWFPTNLRRYSLHVARKYNPVADRPVIGFRLSTLAKLAAKVPLD